MSCDRGTSKGLVLAAGLVADAWIESLREVGADVRYTKVHLHADQARYVDALETRLQLSTRME